MKKFNLAVWLGVASSLNLSLSAKPHQKSPKDKERVLVISQRIANRDAFALVEADRLIHQHEFEVRNLHHRSKFHRLVTNQELQLAAQITQLRLKGKQRAGHKLSTQDQELKHFANTIRTQESKYV